jgi:hypothetical protein
MHISDSQNPQIENGLDKTENPFLLFLAYKTSGTVQEGASQMGAPLMLTKNRNNSPEISNVAPVEEATIATKTTESPEHEEGTAVNGKLDISIKDNSIYSKSDNNNDQSHPNNELKHNYH